MPSSGDRRAEQQRVRRAAAATAKAAAAHAAADATNAASASAGCTTSKVTSAALAQAGTSVMHADLDELVTSTDMGLHEQQWRGGANRHLQPGAHAHQVAASQAAAEKRTAAAMSQEERDARRNATKRAKHAQERAEREAIATAVADVIAELIDQVEDDWMQPPMLDELNVWLEDACDDQMDDEEYDAFCEYLEEMYDSFEEVHEEHYKHDAILEMVADWRSSEAYDKFDFNREADNWDGSMDCESVMSDYETTVDEMYARASPAPPDDDGDDDDPYDDDGYENVDQMRHEWDRDFGPPCHVSAIVKPSHGIVRLRLKVTRQWEQPGSWDYDDYMDAAYANMEVCAYPFVASPSRYAEFKELPPPPRRVDYALGDDGRKGYHRDRAKWYRQRTGRTLTGSMAEQEERFDNACRYLRARGCERM